MRSVAGRLTGAMSAVRFGQEADLLLVVAEAADGVTVHLVPLQTPGLFVESLDSADPTARLARVSFSDCGGAGVVPVLAGPAAERFVAELHAWARILAACELSGIASRLVEITAAFVQIRRQFGRSIGSFQAVKHTVADMHVLAASLRNLCDVALADAATCGHAELGMLGASTKAYAADAAIQVCQSAIQMHGGAGFTTETDLHLYYKRALALRAWYGDHEELTHGIGNALITGSRPTPRLAVS